MYTDIGKRKIVICCHSLRCLDSKEEHLWDSEQMNVLRNAWHYQSNMMEGMCQPGDVLVLVKWEILNKEGCAWHSIGANFLLQHDNNPKHSTKHYKNYWVKEWAGILSIMEWPIQSPDLNRIESLWKQLEYMLSKKCSSSQSNLWDVLQETWGKFL